MRYFIADIFIIEQLSRAFKYSRTRKLVISEFSQRNWVDNDGQVLAFSVGTGCIQKIILLAVLWRQDLKLRAQRHPEAL